MLPILTLLLPLITSVVGKIIPDRAQASQLEYELQKALLERQDEIDKAIAEAAKAQAEVNLAEAQSNNLFIAGWRPAVGWVCAFASAYSFLFQPMASWVAAWFGGGALPALDMTSLTALLTGMLGLGALRTVEKVSGKK